MYCRSRLKILPLLLTWALTLPAQAQEQAPDGNTEDAPPASNTQTEANTAGEEQPPAPADRDPFEYEASEQISEDLSVSFPVDI